MSEFRIEFPKAYASVEEWQVFWTELMAIDRFDPTLLGEVLESVERMQRKPPRQSAWPRCPYRQDTEQWRLWCAVGYAVEIGEDAKARKLAYKLESTRRLH